MKKIFFLVPALVALLILVILFAKTFIVNVFSGQVDFPEERIGQTLIMEDGKKFVVFRRLQISRTNNTADEYAVFKVRFQFKSFGPSINKRLSMIPTPFLINMKGFREKYWTIDETSGFFQGIYQWESKALAEKYPGSFIFKLMTSRSAEGTLSYEIIPGRDLTKYIEERSFARR
ncbi:MAG TPA: hypothetical protein VHO84_06825 [Syntrophorhabdaceae bacterium]|nr:hypothetical protein [Syntrophorhabdaceae bacterium]